MSTSSLPLRSIPWSRFVRGVAKATKDGPVLVLRHGKPCCIAYGFPEAISHMSESECMAALVAQGEHDIATGSTIPHDQVFADLRARLQQAKRMPRKPQRHR